MAQSAASSQECPMRQGKHDGETEKKKFELGEAGTVVRLSASDSEESFPPDKDKNGYCGDGDATPPQSIPYIGELTEITWTG